MLHVFHLTVRLSSILAGSALRSTARASLRGDHGSQRTVIFNLKTVALLREVLDDGWTCLRPEQRASMDRSLLAERILKIAAQGGRDRKRLLDAALMDVAA